MDPSLKIFAHWIWSAISLDSRGNPKLFWCTRPLSEIVLFLRNSRMNNISWISSPNKRSCYTKCSTIKSESLARFSIWIKKLISILRSKFKFNSLWTIGVCLGILCCCDCLTDSKYFTHFLPCLPCQRLRPVPWVPWITCSIGKRVRRPQRPAGNSLLRRLRNINVYITLLYISVTSLSLVGYFRVSNQKPYFGLKTSYTSSDK